MTNGKKAVAIVSGGLDSTTLVYQLLNEGYEVDMLSFDYGQRHKKELMFARALAATKGLKHDIIDLSNLTHLISNSALTSPHYSDTNTFPRPRTYPEPIEVPEGHYAEENMKLTVVPNRNMIMLAIAAGIAINRKANTVAAGMHAGDHFIYPDCRPDFINSLSVALMYGNEGFHNFMHDEDKGDAYTTYYPLLTPFMYSTKAEIAYRALQLGVPLHMTWSCYKGNENHCGRCGTCVERLEAIDEAIRKVISESDGVSDIYMEDMTVYDDNEFWKTQIKKENAS